MYSKHQRSSPAPPAYLHLVHLLLDCVEVSADRRHVAEFNHGIIQPVKHGLKGVQTPSAKGKANNALPQPVGKKGQVPPSPGSHQTFSLVGQTFPACPIRKCWQPGSSCSAVQKQRQAWEAKCSQTFAIPWSWLESSGSNRGCQQSCRRHFPALPYCKA